MRLLLLFALSAAADESWQHYADKNGITVERREVAGSKFFEHRARVSVQKPPQVVLDAIWWGVMNALPKTVWPARGKWRWRGERKAGAGIALEAIGVARATRTRQRLA